MTDNFLKRIFRFYTGVIGWKTDRKIIVIESDDWGSIRMNSKRALNGIIKAGITITDPYNLYDSLASENDLQNLFGILSSYKDVYGNHPVITANTIVGNPDFEKIEADRFEKFHYELFTETLKKYSNHGNSFKIWQDGIKAKVFHPQLHGRDHVNINNWLGNLREGDEYTRISFQHQVFGLRNNKGVRNSFMRALDFKNDAELNEIKSNLKEGIELFNKIFGYYSESFIAPSYVWNSDIEKITSENNVKYLQGINFQYCPVVNKEKLKRIFHYTGQQNKFGQYYLVRNTFFEPSLSVHKNIEETLNRIDDAFKRKKPAIIGSHRLNYIGHINEKNRDINLKLFDNLLKRILTIWPDVEFITSDKLGKLIMNEK